MFVPIIGIPPIRVILVELAGDIEADCIEFSSEILLFSTLTASFGIPSFSSSFSRSFSLSGVICSKPMVRESWASSTSIIVIPSCLIVLASSFSINRFHLSNWLNLYFPLRNTRFTFPLYFLNACLSSALSFSSPIYTKINPFSSLINIPP